MTVREALDARPDLNPLMAIAVSHGYRPERSRKHQHLNGKEEGVSEVATYIIWKEQYDQNVRDVNDVIGIFTGGHEEADEIIEKLNTSDPSVQEGLFGKKRYGYWRSEPSIITKKNLHEFTEGLR